MLDSDWPVVGQSKVKLLPDNNCLKLITEAHPGIASHLDPIYLNEI